MSTAEQLIEELYVEASRSDIRLDTLQNKWEGIRGKILSAGGHPDVEPDTDWGDILA